MALEDEPVINLTTVARVLKHMGGWPGKDSAPGEVNAILEGIIVMLSRKAMVDILKRAVLLKARIERFDVGPGLREFWVLGSPIDTSVALVLHNNLERPRDFTDAKDIINSDNVIVSPDRATWGRVLIDQSMIEGIDALQIAYTGGMALQTGLTGTDGVTAPSGAFSSTAGDFVDDGVKVGHELIITKADTDNIKIYKITNVNANGTDLTVAPDFDAETTAQDFELSTGFISAFPDCAWDVTQMAAHVFQKQGQYGITREAVAGMSVQMTSPIFWPKFLRVGLEHEARKV